MSTPNLVKQVGADITTTTGGLAEELQDGQPLLAPGKPDRLLGHVTDEAARLERLTETRPTITAEIEPDHTGIFDQHAAGGGFFEAEIGPRQPDHQGVSAADTAVDLTVAKGYDLKPPANPVGTLAPALSSAPAGDDINSPALPKLGHLAPAANDMSALAMLDNGVSEASDQLAHDAATGLPKLPTGKDLESSPATGLLDLMLK